MNLTNDLQAEIKRVMDDYWAQYFGGDLDAWLRYLPDDYRNIGTTEEEIWNSKEEVGSYTRAVIHQMAGNVDIRNKQVQVIPYPPYFMVHELGDLFIHAGEEWASYAKFRLSSLIQKTDEGWKVLHQHGSFPDAKAQDGESIGFEKISRENRELREAVKRRTVELEHKNRELEIEAALERVRTQAMSMAKPHDVLNICQALFTELRSLGFGEIRNALINFWHDEQGFMLDYDHSDFAGGHVTRIPYSDHPTFAEFQRQMRSATDAFVELVVRGEQLESWKARRRSIGEYEDPRLGDLPALYYYFYSIGVGAVGISTFAALPEEKRVVLKRFRNAFELAYRRYMDIVQAEAQAREAQVEVALERVRSRTMAMQQSQEVLDVANTLYAEVKQLGFAYGACTIQIMDASTGSMEHWVAGFSHEKYPESYHVPYFDNPCRHAQFAAWRNGDKFLVYELKGPEKQAYDEVMFKETNYKNFPEAEKTWMRQAESVLFSLAYMSHGALHWGPGPLSDEQAAILQRFAKVFEQAYTRFNDLKRAERQAEQARLDFIKLQTEKRKSEEALKELEAAQVQLIQKEKLASLGELTAGIAHEIQNPLNFVNNFSEVSAELVGELREEATKADRDPALMEELFSDLAQNLDKITHHGSRASRIVKGMLDHSRASTGERHPTGLNALTNEYLHLSYQGWVANHPRFACEVITQFDPELGSVDIVPPEIGRVLLNLFNNAFYAVARRAEGAGSSYQPTVWVSTKREQQTVEIRVRDNGTGISEAVKNKIFQPFFTTKPTGEGTGLGLSLSYDIVTKGHGGSLTVSSAPGQFTEFLICLPA